MSALPILLAATIPLRNPFWPVGYHGSNEAISDAPRVKAVVAAPAHEDDTRTSAAAAAAAARPTADAPSADRRWAKARKTLKVGGVLRVSGADARQAVAINGKIYADGDLVSVNHDGCRFTWRVQGVTDNKTLRLVRVRLRECDDEPKGTTGK